MSKYILRRIVISIFVLFAAVFIIYTILRCLPTSYVERMARELSQKPSAKSYQEWVDQLNAVYGLDKGIMVGFLQWLSNAVRGNFGDSWYFTVPVIKKFSQCIGITFALSASAFLLEMIIAVPLGILSARKQYSKLDYGVTVAALIGISLPSFFIATLLKYIFAYKLDWFELSGLVSRYYPSLSLFGKFLDMASHFVLPVMTLAIASMGVYMRHVRTNMLEVLSADYIRTARAKGLTEGRVVNLHAFRNTLIPIITLAGMKIPSLFAGAIVTETLFQFNGLGYCGYQAMTNGDIPFAMFYFSFVAVMTLLGTLLADICYALADPRVRIQA